MANTSATTMDRAKRVEKKPNIELNCMENQRFRSDLYTPYIHEIALHTRFEPPNHLMGFQTVPTI